MIAPIGAGAAAFRLLVAGALTLALGPVATAHEAIDRQIVDLDARIAARPAEAPLYLLRGELHRLHADWRAAARDYRRARALDPDLAAVDLGLARLHLDTGLPAEALVSLDRFLARHPDHADARSLRARALGRLGRSLEAAEEFGRAIAAYQAPSSPDPDLYLERARALAALPAPRLAEAVLGLDEGMRRLGPVAGLALYAIDLEVRLGRIDAALDRLDRLASLSPRKESYLVRRGAILESATRGDEARSAYDAALEAITGLPPERRAARAVMDLERAARSGLERLARPGAPAEPAESGSR